MNPLGTSRLMQREEAKGLVSQNLPGTTADGSTTIATPTAVRGAATGSLGHLGHVQQWTAGPVRPAGVATQGSSHPAQVVDRADKAEEIPQKLVDKAARGKAQARTAYLVPHSEALYNSSIY